MSDDLPFAVILENSADNIDNTINKLKPGTTLLKIVLAQNILKNSTLKKDYGVPVHCYLETEEGWDLAEREGYPCYGVIKDATKLLMQLDQDPRPAKSQAKSSRRENTVNNVSPAQPKKRAQEKPAGPARQERPETPPQREYTDPYEDHSTEMDVYEDDFDDFSLDNEIGDFGDYGEPSDGRYPKEDTYEADDANTYDPNEEIPEELDFGEEEEDYPEEEPEEESVPARKPPMRDTATARETVSARQTPKKEERPMRTQESRRRREPVKEPKRRPEREPKQESKREMRPKKVQVYDDPEQEQQLMEDIGKKKTDTKVVTVYAAKGGVGKTTITSELATYLSLVTRGRKKLRVCAVDYNIDFGDLCTTLAIPKKGANIAYWADEIREYLAEGMKPEEIRYTRDQIEEWLHRDEKTGLYVLPAPVTNEDSSEIRGEEVDIIMDNLKRYGEFDFIVCDTGNNTRNTTMTAIEAADIILLVLDQNINTASCNERFLNTMKVLDFDLSKIRLVVNRVMPSRMTTIPIQELLDCFPYECIGKLKYSTDVLKTTNIGKPMAFYDPDNEFVKQMSEIVAYLLDDASFTEERPKKKGFLSKLFKK